MRGPGTHVYNLGSKIMPKAHKYVYFYGPTYPNLSRKSFLHLFQEIAHAGMVSLNLNLYTTVSNKEEHIHIPSISLLLLEGRLWDRK
jgi:hypothetical protein